MVSMWSENCFPNSRVEGSGLGCRAVLCSIVKSAAWGGGGEAQDTKTDTHGGREGGRGGERGGGREGEREGGREGEREGGRGGERGGGGEERGWEERRGK